MLGYEFEIIYKKGKQNVVANVLTRKDEDMEALHCAISIIQSSWIVEARDKWKNDEEVWTLIKIPVHMIHLARKMIHYGTNITYIFVRIPYSSKILFWNCIHLPLEGTQYF